VELKDLSKPLTVDQIEFRIQSINKSGGATILAYKDARCDMQRLDDVCTPMYWKREHSRDNRNCTISIYSQEIKEWVGKEDTGTESNAEAEKGLASDSFKRSGSNWGIGRELYAYPLIQIWLKGDGTLKQGDKLSEWRFSEKKKDKWGNPQPEPTWNLKLKDWLWYSEFNDGKLSYLSAVSPTNNGYENRFSWGHKKQTEKKQ